MINFVKGDATQPQGSGMKVIAHICNDSGGWGKGFVLALSKRWPRDREESPEDHYRHWFKTKVDFGLGKVQFVTPDKYIVVANMVAQHGTKTGSSGPPIRYDALKKCLAAVAEKARSAGASVHMPRIGCGLAGGRWDKVEPLIEETMSDLSVTIYDYGG